MCRVKSKDKQFKFLIGLFVMIIIVLVCYIIGKYCVNKDVPSDEQFIEQVIEIKTEHDAKVEEIKNLTNDSIVKLFNETF